ncbi:MAG TPA: response regulator [Chthonomonadaceae bacterium]|jgi:DNA-binding response OmpR family regulator|nr:response regulator [Chthonomonadaceae bacterium]
MPKKILAVDDEPHIRRIVQVALQRAGYTVMTASNGIEALEMTATKPDLIILDVNMPYMDGFEVLKNLKENPNTSTIPVIMLTAESEDQDVMRGWEQGADSYLTKPFYEIELVQFVKRVLGPPTTE